MLRTILITFALTAPSFAVAEQFPQSAIDAPVIADDGTVLGRVAAVERDANGRIVAAELPGLEPGDARAVVAERQRRGLVVRDAARERAAGASDRRTTAR